ncbi:MAG: diversity-generating retroelement protein Avd [Parcubacteria group bacterium]|nr:diversity-generating retroelement protein Avd [Parcubacteria group bacterium]
MEELNTPLFKKVYDLYKEFYFCLRDFPKTERYSLGQKCNLLIAELLEHVFQVNYAHKSGKLVYLEQASLKLNLLRIYLRLAKDIRVLKDEEYIYFQTEIEEIGRMLGGWSRFIKGN